MRFVLVATLAGCNYSPTAVGTDAGDGPPDDSDATVAGPIVPSNHADTSPLDAAGLGSLVMDNVADDGTTVWRIYSDTGLIEREAATDTFVEHRAAGLGLDATTQLRIDHVGAFSVLFVDRLQIDPLVSFEGHGTRPLIVIAKGAITISGEIDFSGGFASPGTIGANVRLGGPGGGDGAENTAGTDTNADGCGRVLGTGGHSAGVDTAGDASGGGGGGGGLAGAKGGDKSTGSDDGGAGGGPCMTSELIPLLGGGGGGAGSTLGGGGDGGGGGGALQLSSLTAISVAGTIDVGGKGGRAQIVNDEGGGGGGAGGGILLEAPTISVTGVLAANGGGGGSGRTESAHGTQGTLTLLAAPGGLGSGGGAADGRGGDGGARDTPALAGDNHDPGGGGGGGGVGVVRINVATTGLTLGGTVIISPQHSEGAVVFQP